MFTLSSWNRINELDTVEMGRKTNFGKDTNLLRKGEVKFLLSGKSSSFSSVPRWKGSAISQDRDLWRRIQSQNREIRADLALRKSSRMEAAAATGGSRGSSSSSKVRSWGSRRRRGRRWTRRTTSSTRTTCSSPSRISCCSQVTADIHFLWQNCRSGAIGPGCSHMITWLGGVQ